MTVQLAYQDTPALSYSDIRILTHSPAQNHTQPAKLRMKIAWANSGRFRWGAEPAPHPPSPTLGDGLTPSLTVMLANQC